MNRRNPTLLAGFVLLALGLLATGCASTVTVVPGKSLALVEVSYPDSRLTSLPLAPGEEPPTVRMGRALLREFKRAGAYQVLDARDLHVRPAEIGKDAAKTASLRQLAPADAYVGAKLLGCAARLASATETRGSGASAVTVTVYWYAGDCAVELTAYDAAGKTLAILQKTGRWDSPKQDRADSTSMQSQALTLAIDDAARRLADEIKPSGPEKK